MNYFRNKPNSDKLSEQSAVLFFYQIKAGQFVKFRRFSQVSIRGTKQGHLNDSLVFVLQTSNKPCMHFVKM